MINSKLFWLVLWLIFCAVLYLLFISFIFVEQIRQAIWIKKIKSRHLLIKYSKKFNKEYKNKITYNELKEIVINSDFQGLAERPAWFELYETEKILFFNVPWGEIYCKCTNSEYNDLIEIIYNKFDKLTGDMKKAKRGSRLHS